MAIILKYKFDPSISSDPIPNISGGGTQTTQDVTNADGTITRTIEFTENPTRIYFGNMAVSTAFLEVLEYPINSSMSSFYYLFDGCTNLTYINTANWDTSTITDFDYCFRNCSSLKTIDVTGWDISKSNYRGSLFGNCSSLETLILDSTTGWDKLTTSNNILSGDTKLTKIYMRNSTYTEINYIITNALIDNGGGTILVDGVDNEELIDKATASSKNWTVDVEYVLKYIHTTGVSTVPTFNSGFTYTTTSKDNSDGTTTTSILSDSLPTTISFANLTGLLEVVSAKLNSVTTLNDMFDGCTSLHTVSLKNVDLSNIQNASYLFNNCSSLVNVNAIKTWKNRQNLTTIDYMFSGCSSLSSLECFNGWDLTNTSVTGLFNGCTSLNYLTASSSNIASINKLINVLPTKTATTTGNIKIAPIKMADVDISTAQSKFWNVDDNAVLVTSFKVPADSTTMPVITSEEDLIITTTNDTDGNKIVSIYVGIVLPTLISFKSCSDVIEIYEIHEDIINNMNTHSELFYSCNALERINTTGWTVENSTNLSGMFYNCIKLETVDVSGFNTINVTDFSSMFSNCMKLKSITGIENWNTASLSSATYMFSYTYELETVDVSNFDMTKCTSTSMMFYNSGVKQLDLSKWKFEYTGEFDISRMFSGCYDLEEVGDLSGWGIKRMEYVNGIFGNCKSLKTLNISNWDLSNWDHHSSPSGVIGCSSLETLNVTNTKLGTSYYNQDTEGPSSGYSISFVSDCYSLREIIGWDTITFDKSASIPNFFYGTDALDIIDFSNKDLHFIENMERCFGDSQNLKHVDLSNTQLKQLSSNMFDSGYSCPKFRFLNLDDIMGIDNFTVHGDVFKDDTPDLAVVTANGAYDAYIDQLIKRLPARTQDDPGILKVFNLKKLTNRIDDEKPSLYKRITEDGIIHDYYVSGDIYISYDTIADEKVFLYFGDTKKLDLPIKSAKLAFTTRGYYAYANYYDKNGNQITSYTDPGWQHAGSFEIDVTNTLDEVLSSDESEHGWIRIVVPNDRSSSMYVENVHLYIEYDRSGINGPSIDLETAQNKFWNIESTNVIAEYTFNNSVPVMPVFNDDYTGYEIIDTDNGDGTTTRRIVHDTTLPTSMSFKNCTSLIKVHRIDLSNITHSTSMFEGCSNLQSIGRHYGMFKPINTTAMFKNCNSLTKIDLSTWFATDIKYTSDMFNGCVLLNELIIDDLGRKCTQAPAATTMFTGCTSLTNISIQDSSPIMVKAIIEQILTKTADEPGHLNIRGVKVEDVENISDLETKNWTVEDRDFLITYKFDPNIANERTSLLPVFNSDDLSSSWESSNYLPEVFYYDTVDANGIITRSVYHAHNVPWNMTFNGTDGLLEIIEVNNEPLETMEYFVYNCHDLQKIHLGDLSGKVKNKLETDGYLRRIAYVSSPTALNTIDIDKINYDGMYNLILNLNSPLDDVGTVYIDNLVESIGGGLAAHNSWLLKVLFIEYKFDSTIDTLPLCSTWDPGSDRDDQITPEDVVYRDNDNGDGTITRKIYHGRSLEYIRFSNKPGLLEVIRYNTTDLQSLRRMFDGCTNLTKIHDINEWDISDVYSTYYMFNGCTSLTELDLSKWDTRDIMTNNAQYMFNGCTNLTKINVSGWILQGSIAYMFNECRSLTEIIGIEDWDVSRVTSINVTFGYCESLTELDLSNWDVSNVDRMMSTFHGCKNLKHIHGLENWNTSNVYTMYTLFYGCESIEELDIGNWDVGNVNNMYYIFTNCESLKDLDIVCWDLHNLTIATCMFTNCINLINLDLSGWDVHNLSSAGQMFAGSGITHLNLSNWNVESLSYAYRMFANCNKLKSINLAGWKIKYTASPNLSDLLNDCTKLEEVNLSNWNITNGYNITDIFTGDLKLKHIKMTGCNTSTINKIISLLPSDNTVENAKIFTSLNTELSYLNDTPSNWKVVKGDNIKSEKFLSEGVIKTLIGNHKVKRIHVGDTKIFYHK